MSKAQLDKVSTGRDRGEMDEIKKLILSEKARTKHQAEGVGGGGGGRRDADDDASDDDEGAGDTRERAGGAVGAARQGVKDKKQKGT